MKIRVLISFLIAIILPTLLFGQESEENEEFRRHRFSVGIGHAHIPSELEGENSEKRVMIPSWGLSYSFSVSERFSMGLKSDFEFANYIIEGDDNQELERKNPISLILSFEYKIYKGLSLLAGPGVEFEKNENLSIFIFGAAYEIEIGDRWDVFPELIYELKGVNTGAIIFAFGASFKI